jgi:hypothetical protein
MKSLSESLLKGMDKTLSIDNVWPDIYPIPSVKNFCKTTNGLKLFVNWECPDLIQHYIHNIIMTDRFKHVKKSSITGLLISIEKATYIIHVFLSTDYGEQIELKGVWDWGSYNLLKTKRKCIAFFNQLIKTPDNMKKLVDYHNKCINDINTKGYINHQSFEQILK